jgi:Carboxypeptidase regulatory-like domain
MTTFTAKGHKYSILMLQTVLGLLLPISLLHAQDTATIVGTVSDQSGAFVAGAKVTLVNEATQFTRSVETSASGQYVASSIPTGSYVITVANAGFKQLRRTGVALTAASTLTVDLQLSMGAESQTVAVFGTAPLLQAQTADVSALVDSRQMTALPLVSRDFTDLVLLTPGAHVGSASNLAQGASGYSMRGGGNYSINGAIAGGNSYLVDGIFDRNLWLNTLVMVPIVDSIQEYRVMTSNYSAQYGEAAGAVTEVDTKSGTNGFHGSLWEFLRNDKLNANNYFNNLNHVPRPAFHRNQFGGTFGGPILRNRLFFFVDYEGIRASQPQTATSSVPTVAQQQMVATGNFTNFGTTIYNPYSTTTTGGTTVRNPFPGNQIPASLLDPAAGRLIQLLPAPTSSKAANNYVFNAPSVQQTDQFDVRIDQNLGASDHLFVRYGYDKSNFTTPGIVPSPANSPVPIGPYLSTNASGTIEPLFNQSATVGYTKVVGAKFVSDSHLGLVRWHAEITPLDQNFNTATALGIPGINFNQHSGGLPAFTVSGLTEIGDNSTYPEDSAITSIQLDSAATVIRGAHTLKFGVVAIRHWFNGFSAFPTRGTFDFNGQFTRQIGSSSSTTALADFALGAMDTASRNSLVGTFGMRFWQLAPFVQDSWRATDRLTLNVGIRWDIDAPPYEAHNHWANLNIATGQLMVAGVNGNSRRLRSFDLDTFGPRLGLAYAVTSDRKTIIRSGFGLSFVYTDAGGAQLYKNLPYYVAQTVTTNTNSAPTQTLSQGLPLPVPPSSNNEAALSVGSPQSWNQHLKQSLIASWSLGVQRQLTSSLMLDVTYLGTRGDRLLINSVNLNQAVPGSAPTAQRRPYFAINPNLVNVPYLTSWGQSKYQALQAHLEQRLASGLTFGASYTYSAYLSDAGNPNGGGNSNYQNDQCIACNWGPTPDDYKHVLSVNHAYELPFGTGRKFVNHGPLAYVVAGWDVNGIWSAYSGGRFTAILGTNVSNQSGGGDQRPNRIGRGTLPPGQRNINQWFKLSDFVAPPQYTFGNSGTGILTGPGYFDVDLGVNRTFRLTEKFGLTYRAEWFNSFNHANFNNPNASIGTAPAGTISGTQPPRIIQMALKLAF